MLGRLILALLLALASVAPAIADELSISGEVTYRERIALPPQAVLRVRLIEAGTTGMPVVVEAEGAIASPGSVPLSFTLRFDEDLLRAGQRYAVAADIVAAGELWFSTFAPLPVDPVAGTLDDPVILTFAGHPGEAAATAAVAPPVAEEAGPSSLLNVVWRVDAVGSEPIDPALEASLSIGSDLRAGGRGGCNSYFAQVWLEGAQLQFSSIAATRMACSDPAAAGLETAFFAALEATRLWRIADDTLLLLDEANQDLLSFRAATR